MGIYKISNNQIYFIFVITLWKIILILGKENNKENTIIFELKSISMNKSFVEKEKKEKNFYNLIVNKLIPNNLYIDFQINSEKNIKIPGYLTFTSQYNIYGTDICLKLDIDNLFNISSKTEYLPSFQLYNNEYQIYYYLKENISLFDSNHNKININDIDIIIPENNEKQAGCLIVGLNSIIDIKQNKGLLNLPLSIKSNKITNNLHNYLTILYQPDINIMLLGEPLHILYPNLYNIKNYKEIDNYNFKQSLSSFFMKNHGIWSMKLGQIFIDNKTHSLNEPFIAQFSLDYIPFIVPMEIFRKYLSISLDHYISKNICSQKGRPLSKEFAHSIINDKKQTFIFIHCKKDKIENVTEFYENMPEFSFRNKELNKTFSFKGKDLFVEEANFLVLMLIPDMFNKIFITLGKMFMEKYLFCFNYDRNVIGFYDVNITKIDLNSLNKNNDNNKSNQISENKFPLEFYWIIISIFFFVCLIIIFNLFRCKKVKGNYLKSKGNNINENLIERELIDVNGEKDNL